jgi:hypothetical protein
MPYRRTANRFYSSTAFVELFQTVELLIVDTRPSQGRPGPCRPALACVEQTVELLKPAHSPNWGIVRRWSGPCSRLCFIGHLEANLAIRVKLVFRDDTHTEQRQLRQGLSNEGVVDDKRNKRKDTQHTSPHHKGVGSVRRRTRWLVSGESREGLLGRAGRSAPDTRRNACYALSPACFAVRARQY